MNRETALKQIQDSLDKLQAEYPVEYTFLDNDKKIAYCLIETEKSESFKKVYIHIGFNFEEERIFIYENSQNVLITDYFIKALRSNNQLYCIKDLLENKYGVFQRCYYEYENYDCLSMHNNFIKRVVRHNKELLKGTKASIKIKEVKAKDIEINKYIYIEYNDKLLIIEECNGFRHFICRTYGKRLEPIEAWELENTEYTTKAQLNQYIENNIKQKILN